MAKTKQQRIRMTVGLSGHLSPTTPYDLELMSRYSFGKTVEVSVWQDRSLPHHRTYWGVLHHCVTNSEGKYGSTDDLHNAIKVSLGYTRRLRLLIPSAHASVAAGIKKHLTKAKQWLALLVSKYLMAAVAECDTARLICQEIDDSLALAKELETEREHITLPGSISFESMDQSEFRVFFDRAMEQLRLAGYPVDEYLSEITQQLGPR